MKPVREIRTWNLHLVPGFNFDVIALPANRCIDDENWKIDAEAMGVPAANGQLNFRVTAADDRAWAARAVFGAGDLSAQCCQICVHEDYRRRGIALAMYRWTSCLFDAPVKPSEERTAFSLAFWKDRTEIVCR